MQFVGHLLIENIAVFNFAVWREDSVPGFPFFTTRGTDIVDDSYLGPSNA